MRAPEPVVKVHLDDFFPALVNDEGADAERGGARGRAAGQRRGRLKVRVTQGSVGLPPAGGVVECPPDVVTTPPPRGTTKAASPVTPARPLFHLTWMSGEVER
jgi:hypothetical protein